MSKEFTAKQKEIVARKLGYDGPMQGFDEFLQSSPALAMKYGMIADKYMAKGGMVKKYQAGGTVPTNDVAGLYQQYLNRAPDAEGLKFYTDYLAGDGDFETVRNSIMNSPEAQARTSKTTTTSPDLVAKVRERYPNYNPNKMTMDYDEADAYMAELINQQGADTRADPTEQFTTMPVNPPVLEEAQRAQQFATGTAATDEQINDLYRRILGRDADAGGLQFYKGSNFSADQIREQLSNSPEAKDQQRIAEARRAQEFAKFNTASDEDIRGLYRSVLGREADAGGLEFYKKSNFSADQIRQQLLNSPEYKNKTNPDSTQRATPTAQQLAEQQKIVNDQQGAALSLVRSGIAGNMSNQQIADLANSQYGKSFSAQNVADFIRDNKIEDTRGKPKVVAPTTYGPTGVPQPGTVSQVTAAQTAVTPGMTLDSSQYTAGAAPTAATTTAQAAAPVAAPTPVRTTPVTAVKTTGAVMEALAPLAPFTGTAPVIEAAQLTPEQMQAAMVQAQQLDKAQQVQLAQRRLQEGELVSGPTVDQQRVEQAIAQTQAAQGRVTEEMTVQGQLAKLTADFDTRNPPPWAAGAVRAATSMLAARGLGASSMAGQAIIQATMESAIPIASADAAVYQQMEAQNLSNRQQVAVLAAQQRAQFLGQEFDQAFQTRVLNAAKIADIANMNFTAEQQVYLENARLAQSVDLANLNNRQATVMANAATIANMQTANLSARQQSLVANAQNFLQMSMANMSNQQQVALFKAQELTQSIMSDAAAENSARQFNASNQQQADQFNSQITTQVSQFNALQKNAMEQFNAGQANALAQFNSQMKAQREEFNVKNRTIIDQANAQLLAQISLSNTAATNAANFENARAMNNMTMSQYNNEVQLYRDQVKMVFDSYERQEDRAASMATAVLQAELAREKMDADTSASIAKLFGSVITGTKLGDKIIDAGTDFLKNLFRP